MDKSAVAEVLDEIGTLLELKGENAFKCRAYHNAARTLETLSVDLGQLVKDEQLGTIKGLGEALQAKVAELVLTGKLAYYDELKSSFPPGLLELLEIPGLGPKKVKILFDQLQVTSIGMLQLCCERHVVAKLPGFGEKTETNILLGIHQRKTYASQFRYFDVIERAEELIESLRSHPDVVRVNIAGSLRRGKEVVKDMDLLASSSQPAKVMDFFVSLAGIERVTNHGETKSSVILEGGLACDLRVVSDRQFPYALAHFTGSKEHNVALRQRAIERGWRLSEWGLFDENEKADQETSPPTEGTSVPPAKPLILCFTEEEIHRALDLDYIPPELRENLGEVEAAAQGKLPRLVEWSELRGTFHCHTSESDGKNTLKEMAEAAASIGLEYLGIADHSKSSYQANGLDEERVRRQQEEIKKLNQELAGDIVVLSGIECDILKEGRLDFSDDFLATFDYVVASIHTTTNADEEENTLRLIRAMENRQVTILGHPTGRLLLAREPYKVNLAKVIDCAAATGTWIELNANPWRLDLDWRWWHQARDKGVLCAINPDAHRMGDFGYLKSGTNIARKGWLRKQDVVNTLPWGKMQAVLQKKRQTADEIKPLSL